MKNLLCIFTFMLSSVGVFSQNYNPPDDLDSRKFDSKEQFEAINYDNGNRRSSVVEAEEGLKNKETPAQKYLEIGIDSVHRGNFAAAEKFFQLAADNGDDKIYAQTQVWSYYIRALQGDTGFSNELITLDEKIMPKAMYYASDGWQTYFDENPDKAEVFDLSIEYRERLIAQYPATSWAMQATMQLVTAFMSREKYDRVLYYIFKYMEMAKNKPTDNTNIELDRAWYYLGLVLENSREFRDLYRALESYHKVDLTPNSRYSSQAKQRINEIEKFYFISQ